MSLNIIVISKYLDQKEALLNSLVTCDSICTVSCDVEHTLQLLSQDSHSFDALILSSALYQETSASLEQLRATMNDDHFPIFLYGPSISTTLSKSYRYLNTQLDLPLFWDTVQEYAKTHKVTGNMGLMDAGKFKIRTLKQAYLLANYLAQQCPNPSRVTMGLTELLINAIEHGNLEISFEEKSTLLSENRWQQEIHRRLNHPDYKDRFVRVSFEHDTHYITITIQDEGKGFQWEQYEQIDPKRFLASHGRGIMMAKSLSFDLLSYDLGGTRVCAQIDITKEAS